MVYQPSLLVQDVDILKNCDLCKLVAGNVITKKYYKDSDFIIVDCKTCGPGAPMIIWKPHSMALTERKIKYIKKLSEELFGNQITFREEQKKIKDHWHIHIEGAIID